MVDIYAKECKTCKRDEGEVRLSRCPVCYQYYCGDHKYLMSGREFCGPHCARYFFFPDDEG